MKKIKSNKPTLKKVLLGYGFHIWFLLFVVNIAIFYATQFHARGQTCLTPTQVQADNRCLYILSNKVYEKDSRNSPHHGHPCGTDVTSVVPSSHTDSAANYLDPNYVGDICIAPTAIPTVAPVPTNIPVATAVPQSTVAPSVLPSITTSGVPNPQCLGTPCPTNDPSQLFPTINPNISGIPSGTGGGGGGFFALLLALIQLILRFLFGGGR